MHWHDADKLIHIRSDTKDLKMNYVENLSLCLALNRIPLCHCDACYAQLPAGILLPSVPPQSSHCPDHTINRFGVLKKNRCVLKKHVVSVCLKSIREMLIYWSV